MAEQPPQQQPGEGLSDEQQAALVQIGKMMGPHADDFDQQVQAMHDKRHQSKHDADDGTYGQGDEERPHEAGYKKMHAAQTSTGLGPTQAEQAAAKQSQALQQQAATSGQAQAEQAQAQQPPPSGPPPAPSGPEGSTTPYPAQAHAVGGAGQPPQGQPDQGEQPEQPQAPEPQGP